MRHSLFSGLALIGLITLMGCEAPTDSAKTKDTSSSNSPSDSATVSSSEKVHADIPSPSAYDGDFNPEAMKVGSKVGQLAPEISGEDLDGIPFKLSDYRGKVVMLDFYGDW